MVTEIAYFQVDPTRQAEIEVMWRDASGMIAAAEGCHGLRMLRCIEVPGRYALCIEWDSVDHHTAFSASGVFVEHKARLDRVYSEKPAGQHFDLVFEDQQ